MAKRKGTKTASERAKLSKAKAVATEVDAANITATVAIVTTMVEAVITEPTSRQEATLEGDMQDLPEVQDRNNDEEGEITDQARGLKRLDEYQQEIVRLQQEKERLLQ
jgi:hypothetical protein